jgi:hypothetical protein
VPIFVDFIRVFPIFIQTEISFTFLENSTTGQYGETIQSSSYCGLRSISESVTLFEIWYLFILCVLHVQSARRKLTWLL